MDAGRARVSRMTLLTSAAVLAVVLGTLGPGDAVGFGTPLVSTQPGRSPMPASTAPTGPTCPTCPTSWSS